MGKSYKITVNEQHEFEVNSDHISQLDKVKTGDKHFHLIKDDTSYRVEITDCDYTHKTFHILVNDRNYIVAIEDEFDQLVARLGLSNTIAQKVNSVKAPMPGLVLEVSAKVGEEVQQGDVLLILEAMKMENVIKSAGDGVIKAIHVSKGKAVEKGALLIEME